MIHSFIRSFIHSFNPFLLCAVGMGVGKGPTPETSVSYFICYARPTPAPGPPPGRRGALQKACAGGAGRFPHLSGRKSCGSSRDSPPAESTGHRPAARPAPSPAASASRGTEGQRRGRPAGGEPRRAPRSGADRPRETAKVTREAGGWRGPGWMAEICSAADSRADARPCGHFPESGARPW